MKKRGGAERCRQIAILGILCVNWWCALLHPAYRTTSATHFALALDRLLRRARHPELQRLAQSEELNPHPEGAARKRGVSKDRGPIAILLVRDAHSSRL
jgi:hypothetical protein